MPVQIKASGDPRRAEEAVKYVRPKVEETAGDFMLIVAVIIGAASLIFKWRLGGWSALLCTLQAIANMKSKDFSYQQVISALTFSILGIVGTYLYVPPSRTPLPLKT